MSGASEIASAQGEVKETKSNRLGGLVRMNFDWITRPLFGLALAGLAILATIRGGLVFVIFISLGCSAAIREWHRLFARRDFVLPAVITVLAMLGALLWRLETPPLSAMLSSYGPFVILLIGTLCNVLLSASRHEAPLAHAAGPLYIAFPALSLLMVRQTPAHPVWLVVLIFLAVWTTDTGALFSGNLIGGPKLAPRLSPNKTWAGSFGGFLCAAIGGGAVAAFLHASVWRVVAFSLVLSLAGQAGDLFESLAKRRVGRKDSGGLIPGHGGVLDRIDSILFAAPVAAVAILVVGFDPLAGAHP